MESTVHYFYPWLKGEIIYDVMGRVVVKSTAATGEAVAVKVCHRDVLLKSEADMLQHVTQNTSVKAPKLHRVYEVDSARVMETDFVPGVPLDTVWGSFGIETKAAIASQLQEQVLAIRTSTQSFIGRVNFQPTFDIYRPLQNQSCGAFLTECQFDAHKVHMLEADGSQRHGRSSQRNVIETTDESYDLRPNPRRPQSVEHSRSKYWKRLADLWYP